MDPFTLNLILLAPLFLGIVLSQVLRLNLRALQAVYLFLVAGNVVLSYFLLDSWLPAVVAAGVGLLLVVILAGVFGQRVRPGDYGFAQMGVGLFPWLQWGFTAALIYGIILIMFAVLVALRPKFKNPFFKNRKSGTN